MGTPVTSPIDAMRRGFPRIDWLVRDGVIVGTFYAPALMRVEVRPGVGTSWIAQVTSASGRLASTSAARATPAAAARQALQTLVEQRQQAVAALEDAMSPVRRSGGAHAVAS